MSNLSFEFFSDREHPYTREAKFQPDVLEGVTLNTQEAKEFEQFANRVLGVPVSIVNRRTLTLYNVTGLSIKQPGYVCQTNSSEYHYLKIAGELRRLPTRLNDTHGAASICNSCPHQLKCAVGQAEVIMPHDFPEADQQQENVIMARSEDTFGNIGLRELTMRQQADLACAFHHQRRTL